MGIPRPKQGQIKLAYGKLSGYEPDLIVSGGSGTERADQRVVMNALDVLCRELDRRGYDPKTVRFSIEMRPTEE